MTRRRRGQRGFTLLEVLVALGILSVSLAAIYQAFGAGLHNESQTRRYWEAAVLAEARMAQIGTTMPASVGEWRGETADGYRWTASLRLGEDEPAVARPGVLRLLEIEVAVFWTERGRDRSLRLVSLRLGNVAAGEGQ